MALKIPFFLLLVFLLSFPSPISSRAVPETSQTGVVGVVYSMSTAGLPPPKQVADALVDAGVSRVLLIDTYPEGIAAFNGTPFHITIGVNNSVLPLLAANRSEAIRWIGDHIIGPNVAVGTISVGHDLLSTYIALYKYLLPALRNLQAAFTTMGLDMSLTTSCSYDIICPGFPPSEAHFNSSVAETHVMPLMEFLTETSSPFLIQLYPFKLYNSDVIPRASTGLATFDSRPGIFLTDPKTGLVYQNMFDAMVDATVAALDKLGYPDIRVVVAGTGWPSEGTDDQPEASPVIAAEYTERLVSRLSSGAGTPALPDVTPVAYIFSLFDGPMVAGMPTAWNWGIWTKDMQQKYIVDFASAANVGGRARRTLISAAAGWAAAVALFW
ncbi:hypothetical protein Taro_028508 [Colocasia esculenta]|uniref:Glucan endo-1,3-beta-D-glucosidase n=1 Tax=Colocasia esculenta TaxID=4460 RepID=A0A843VS11_COLES|nr:hypothetical protein [Colocasia esculenta]